MDKQKVEFIESYIKIGNGNYEWNDNHGELIRCKDCKHGEKTSTFRYYPNLTWCNKYERSHDDDWFCADGEVKNDA